MHQVYLFPLQDFGKPNRAPPIYSFTPTKNFDGEPLIAQVLADRACLVQTNEEEAALVPQLPAQSCGQHFRAANVQRVQELTNRRLPAFAAQ